MKKKVELVVPAGNREKCAVAIAYGADAVYMGLKTYSLRAAADEVEMSEIAEAVSTAHRHGKKLYVALNIIAHNKDISAFRHDIESLRRVGADAVIVSDPGMLEILREAAPEIPVHLSTQANCTNWKSLQFWKKQGIRRVIVARELSFKEISDMIQTADAPAVEVFVHGSLCLSYAGRCFLSHYLTGRSANQGKCAHSCRWNYALVEEKRPGEYLPVCEDAPRAMILSPKDLCMIAHIPELIETGVDALKIEGRMRSAYYLACVIRVYREAIDSYYRNPAGYRTDRRWMEELQKMSHRGYTTGFFFNHPQADDYQHTQQKQEAPDRYRFLGIVDETVESPRRMIQVDVRNRISRGDTVEFISGSLDHDHRETIEEIWSTECLPVQHAHPNQKVGIVTGGNAAKKYDMVRSAL